MNHEPVFTMPTDPTRAPASDGARRTRRSAALARAGRSAVERSLVVALAALVSLLPAPGAAQVDTTATESADTFDLPAVVVTATRVPLDRRALPTPVTVLTGAELRDRGVRTVAEALREVPGAAVVRSGGTGAQSSLFLRGGESDYVKVLIDGVAVNDPGGSFDFADLSTDQVERIEVVRGPTSVLYGTDAVAGVVQVFTRRGTGAPTLTARVTGGSGARTHDGERYGTYDAEATASGSTGPFAYAVGGGRQYSGGLYPLNNQRSLNTGTLRLGWTAPTGAELRVSSRVSDGRAHFPTDGAGQIVDENAYLDRRLWTTSVAGGWRLDDRLDARVQLGLVTRDQTSVDRQDGPDDTDGVYASTLAFDGTRHTADARLNAHLPGGTLTAGIAWESAEAETSYDSESAFGPYDASARFDRATTGYYVQLLTQPIDALHFTAGGRIDDSDTYGAFHTYRIGAAVRVAPGTRLRGAVGRGFREPTFAESFGSGFGDVGNEELEPERSRSWEVGVEQELGRGTVAATWFDQDFDDLIQYTFAPPAEGGPNYFNVGSARARGLELEARAGAERWSATASYSWLLTEVVDPGLATDATFVAGQALLRRPEHSGAVTGRLKIGQVGLSTTLNVVGEREDVDYGAGFPAPRVTLPGYATVDLAGEYTLPLAGPGTTLLVRLENALDARHEAIAGFPGQRRLLRLGARVRVHP